MDSDIAYIATCLGNARAANAKVLFVGFDPAVLTPALGAIGLDGFPFLFVSDRPSLIGKSLLYLGETIRIHGLAEAEAFQPDLAVLMPPPGQNAPTHYERLLHLLDISSAHILMVESHWDRLAHRDQTPDALADAVPSHIGGGVSCREIYLHIHDCLKQIAAVGIPGDVVNLGVYQGWSMYFIALAMEQLGLGQRKLIGFDTFSGFMDTGHPLDSYTRSSILGQKVFTDVSLEMVEANLARFPFIELVAGDIHDTIAILKGRPVALALFDMDDYTPTAVALGPVYESLSPMGMMVHDHYAYHTLTRGACAGQRLAAQEFLAGHPMFCLRGTNVMVKLAAPGG